MFKHWQSGLIHNYCLQTFPDNFMGHKDIQHIKNVTKSNLTLLNLTGHNKSMFNSYIKGWELKIKNINNFIRKLKNNYMWS